MRICIWKELIEDENSSSGYHMRERKYLPCFECDGRRESAISMECREGIQYFNSFDEEEENER